MKFSVHKYEGLQLSAEFARLATEDPQKILDCCNGVGSKIGFWNKLIWHIIPNTIYFLNITPVSDIHDVDCTYPSHFKNKDLALKHLWDSNMRFRENLETFIDIHTQNKFMLYLRLKRAIGYYVALVKGCETSFMEGKTFDEN